VIDLVDLIERLETRRRYHDPDVRDLMDEAAVHYQLLIDDTDLSDEGSLRQATLRLQEYVGRLRTPKKLTKRRA
jgi:hypothetical protein